MAEPLTTDLTSSREGPPWLTPGVRGIGAASLLADLGHEIPTALLPSLLTSTLGAPASALGLIEGVSDALAGATRFAGGPLADDPHRRRSAAVGGYAGTAILSGLVGVATSVWQVGVLRAGAWAARGLRVPSRNALLADVVTPGMYGRAYGFERAMDNLGAIGGPLLALALIAVFSVRTAILLSIIPGLLAVLAILYAIRHTPKPTERERQPLRFKVRPVLRGRLGRFLGGVTLFEAANMAATLMILRASDLLEPSHGQQRATEIAIGLYVLYNVAATLISIPGGSHGDRRGMVRVFAVGVGCFAVAYAGFAFTGASILFWVRPSWWLASGSDSSRLPSMPQSPPTHRTRSEAPPSDSSQRSRASGTSRQAPSWACSTRSPRHELAFGYASVVMVVALASLIATTTLIPSPVPDPFHKRGRGPFRGLSHFVDMACFLVLR